MVSMSPSTMRGNRYCWMALILILALAAYLRCQHLGRYCLWLDELGSIRYANGYGGFGSGLQYDTLMLHPPVQAGSRLAGPWWKLGPTLGDDFNPPLYYFVLRFWRELLGSSDVATKSLSIVASLAGIAMLFAVGRRLHGPGPALWACLIMALALPQILYAREARSYALLIPLSLACIWAMLRLEERPSPGRCVTLAFFLLASMLTHYYAAAPLIGLAAYALIRCRGKTLRWTVGAFIAAAIVFVILWGPILWRQFHATVGNNSWTLDTRPHFLSHTLLRLGAWPRLAIDASPSDTIPCHSAAAGVLFVIPFLLLRRRPDLLIWALWLAGGVGIVLAADLCRHSLQLQVLRYTLAAMPGVYMLLGTALWHYKPWVIRLALPLAATAACAIALTMPEAYGFPSADWRDLAKFIQAHQKPGDVYVFASLASPPDAAPQAAYFYDGITHYGGPMPGPTMLLTAAATPPQIAQITAAAGPVGEIWLLAGPNLRDPSTVLPRFHPDAQTYNLTAGFAWRGRVP